MWCRPILTCGPRGMVGRIYVVNHYLLNIEAVGSWFQKIFKLFSSKSMEAKDPEGLVNLEPRGMVGMIYVGDHQTLLYTKYISCGPLTGLTVME